MASSGRRGDDDCCGREGISFGLSPADTTAGKVLAGPMVDGRTGDGEL